MSKSRRTNLKAEPLIETSTVPTETYPGVGYEQDPSVHAPKVPDLKKPKPQNPDKGFLREVEEDAGLDDMVLTQPIRYIVDPKDAIEKMEALNRKVEESRPDLAPQVEVVNQAIQQLEQATEGQVAPIAEQQPEVPAFNEGDRVSVTLEDGVYEGMVEKANDDGTFAVRTDQAMTLQNVPATSMQKAEVKSMTLPASLRMRLQAARMITDAIAEAFKAGKKSRIANTSTDGQTVWLHNNAIVRKAADGSVEVSLAGWPTATTRERINGILSALGLEGRVSQRGGAQMLNGKPWDGDWASVGPAVDIADIAVTEKDMNDMSDRGAASIKQKADEGMAKVDKDLKLASSKKVKADKEEEPAEEMEECQDCGTKLDPEKGEVFLTDDGGIYCADCFQNHEGEGEDDSNREPDPEMDIIIGDDDLSAHYAGKEIVSITREEADADEDALEKAVAAWMDENNYWPDVFTVSDHGNSNLVTERFFKFTKGAAGDEKAIKSMLGLSAGSSWYVGHKGGKAEAFQSDEEPTETSHPQYGAVTGPFKTEQGARYGADYKGPILQHVDEFEEAAHREGMVAMAAKKKNNKVKAAEPTNTTQTGAEKGKVKSGYEPTGIQVVEEGGKPRVFDPAKDDVVPAELYKNAEGKFALVNPNGENTYEEGANDELEFSYWATIKSLTPAAAEKPTEAAPAPEPAKTEQKPAEVKEAVAASAKATALAARAKVKAAKAKPAAEVKASAFDEIPEIELGGGFKAKRKAGKEAKEGEEAVAAEIEVVDADGKVKATYPDAFGDDTVTIIKFLRQVLDIKEGDDKAAAKKEEKGEKKGEKKGEGGESDIAEKPKALPATKDEEPKKETEKEEEQLAANRMLARMENIRLIAVRLLRSGHIQANLDDVDDGLVKGLTLAGAQEAAAKKAVDRKVLDLLAQPEDELLLIKASLPLLEDRRVTVQASDGGLGPINLSASGVIDVSGKQESAGLGAAFGRGFQRR